MIRPHFPHQRMQSPTGSLHYLRIAQLFGLSVRHRQLESRTYERCHYLQSLHGRVLSLEHILEIVVEPSQKINYAKSTVAHVARVALELARRRLSIICCATVPSLHIQ